MENKTPNQSETRLNIEATQDSAIAKVNKKVIYVSIIAILVVLGVAAIGYWIYKSGNDKANEAIGKADIEQNDSIKMAMYKQLADDGSYAANERAKLVVATRYYSEGKYQEAINYLDKASVKSQIIQTGAYTLKGDCYANLDKLDEALKCYNDALDEADNNPQLVPFVLVKMANIYRAQKNYEKELGVYTTIRTDYPGFMNDIDKYYERAKAAAGK